MEAILIVFIGGFLAYLFIVKTVENKFLKYKEEKKQQQIERFAENKKALKYHVKCVQLCNLISKQFPGSSLSKQHSFKIIDDFESPFIVLATGYIYNNIYISTKWEYGKKGGDIKLELFIEKYIENKEYIAPIVKPSIMKTDFINYNFELDSMLIVENTKEHVLNFLNENK